MSSKYQDIIDEADRLRECISEMCTTNSLLRLSHLYSSAGIALSELMLKNGKRIRNKEEK